MPAVFVIDPTEGSIVRWFNCSDAMREPSDMAATADAFYICDVKVPACLPVARPVLSCLTYGTQSQKLGSTRNLSRLLCRAQEHCVMVFNAIGLFVARVGGEKLLHFPIGVDVSASGALLVAHKYQNRLNITVFDLRDDGALLHRFECEEMESTCAGLRIARDGRLVTLSKKRAQVLVLEAQRLPAGDLLLPPRPSSDSSQQSSAPFTSVQHSESNRNEMNDD